VAQIRPFAAVRFSRNRGFDLSNLIAPPYDVLDDAGKAALQARHPNNIVTIDLPHLPAKTVGPDAAYAKAAVTLQSWLSAGILERDAKAAIYPYTQSFVHGERTFHRRGMVALVKLSPFGEGHVFPHEKTYADAIQDRLKLTRATHTQLSPIFGLFSDPRGEITNLLNKNLSRSDQSGLLDGVRNDLWAITDSERVNAVTDQMSARPIYIADGHHRYTMALQYQKEMIEKNGGKLPPNHPANFCMFVLVGMQDDGLLILPTHRLIGGITSFDISVFKSAIASVADVTELTIPESELPHYIESTLPRQPPHTFGLFDGRTRKTYQLVFKNPDVLKDIDPKHSAVWRRLDVAIVQRFLLDEVIKSRFGAGADPTRGYTAESKAVAPLTDGKRFQIALLLKSTPLHALEELGKTNEVMPAKSTYFFPKLATGLTFHPLE
jgi:uncharacterized protein (DUF1015 family)